jgi:hypothetical protein
MKRSKIWNAIMKRSKIWNAIWPYLLITERPFYWMMVSSVFASMSFANYIHHEETIWLFNIVSWTMLFVCAFGNFVANAIKTRKELIEAFEVLQRRHLELTQEIVMAQRVMNSKEAQSAGKNYPFGR